MSNILRGKQEAEQEEWNRTWWLVANFIGSKNMPKLPWHTTARPTQPTRPAIWDEWDAEMKKRHGRQ